MQKMMQRGFTLIELLVVIAIIGILAAVVLASLNDARTSGSDASIKQSMAAVRSQAELFYNRNNFSYSNLCTNSDIQNLISAIDNANGEGSQPDCDANALAWKVTSPLVATTSQWCVDSRGFSGSTTTSPNGSAFTCR